MLNRPRFHAALNRVLFDEEGFRGNEADYYDPRNSYLSDVIDRRTGIPITLAIVYLEVGWRVGLNLEGIGFPGHFLVRYTAPEGIAVLDAFDAGRILSQQMDLDKHLVGFRGETSSLHYVTRFTEELLAAEAPAAGKTAAVKVAGHR